MCGKITRPGARNLGRVGYRCKSKRVGGFAKEDSWLILNPLEFYSNFCYDGWANMHDVSQCINILFGMRICTSHVIGKSLSNYPDEASCQKVQLPLCLLTSLYILCLTTFNPFFSLLNRCSLFVEIHKEQTCIHSKRRSSIPHQHFSQKAIYYFCCLLLLIVSLRLHRCL